MDDSFMLYRSASGPSGYGFTGNAARMRVYDGSTTGFVIENSSDEALFSVRGSDALTAVYGNLAVADDVSIRVEGTDAVFSHTNASHPAIRQTIKGATYVGSAGSVVLRSSNSDMLSIDSNGTTIANELIITSDNMQNTMFRSNGDNFISTGAGKSTHFSSGNSVSVSIKDREVVIDGTSVLASLKSLESEIKSFENDTSYVKHGSGVSYWIQGHADTWSKELSYNGNTTTWNPNNTRMKVRFHKN